MSPGAWVAAYLASVVVAMVVLGYLNTRYFHADPMPMFFAGIWPLAIALTAVLAPVALALNWAEDYGTQRRKRAEQIEEERRRDYEEIDRFMRGESK